MPWWISSRWKIGGLTIVNWESLPVRSIPCRNGRLFLKHSKRLQIYRYRVGNNISQQPKVFKRFDDIIDKFTIIKGQANQNENWFYVEYYQQDDIFAQLTDVFKNHFVGRSKHEIDSNLFLNMVLSYVNQCNMEVTEDEI